MDLASVVAALASVGVRVSGSTPNSSVQVDSSRACPTGLAGPEPSGTFHDPGQHFHLFLGQPWLHAHRVSPMGHRTCFLQDPSTSDPSDLYYLHPYTKSINQFQERNKLHIQQDGQEWTGNQEELDEGKVESLNCKNWKSVCYRVVDKWRDILVDYFEGNHNFVLKLMPLQTRRIKDFRSSTTMPGVRTGLNHFGSICPSTFFLVWCRN